MIIFVILGALLGVISAIFVLQNITPVTVTFFSMHLDGSLAVMLFLSLLSGVAITLLFLLPSLIRDGFRMSRLKKQVRTLEDTLDRQQSAASAAAVSRASTATPPETNI